MLQQKEVALLYRTFAYMVENTTHSQAGIYYGNPMCFWFDDMYRDGRVVWRAVENFNIDLNHHGDEYGMQISRLGNQANVKAILGHTHAPKQIKGIIQVGDCMVPNPTYQTGMNCAAQSLVILHDNGKRQHLINL